MPIVRVPLNCGHYWLLCGAGIGYFLFHPKYQAPFEDVPVAVYVLALLFMVRSVLQVGLLCVRLATNHLDAFRKAPSCSHNGAFSIGI